MSNMQFIRFAEYETIAQKQSEQERYGQFVWYDGQMVKRHPGPSGFNWRPIRWCDRCKEDITEGLYFATETRTALCPSCAEDESGDDKALFASIGISFDG